MRIAPLSVIFLLFIFTPTSRLRAQTHTVSVAGLRVPENARRHYEKAREAARARREDVFQKEIDKAIQIAPDYADPYLLMADRENGRGLFQQALAHGVKAHALDPDAPWVSIVLASAYNGLGRYDEAHLILANLHGPDVDTWQAVYEMARAEVGRNEAADAVHWAEMALKRAPSSCLDAHLLMANALQLVQRWRDAADQIELYLAAGATPAERRAPVELALAHIRLRAEEQERSLTASAR